MAVCRFISYAKYLFSVICDGECEWLFIVADFQECSKWYTEVESLIVIDPNDAFIDLRCL